MGNSQILSPSTSKKILDQKTLKLLERRLLEYAEVSMDSIQQLDVPVGEFDAKTIFVNTIVCGSTSKPKLVWVHGWAAAGALFYTIIQPIISKYCLIFMDMVGMGGSSRPKNFYKNVFGPQEAIDYLVGYMETWREKMGLKKFYLAGHSFGGYISGHYALRYLQNVKKLLLVSPVGVRVTPVGESWVKALESTGRGGPPKYVQPAIKYVWDNRIPPFGVLRLMGPKQANNFIPKYVLRSVKNETQDKAIQDFLYQIIMRPSSQEAAIQVLFTPSLQAHIPLGSESLLASSTFPIPISVFYGDEDWTVKVDLDAASNLLEQNQQTHGEKSNLYVIDKAGHNMHVDNPVQLARDILADLEK